MIFNTRTMTQQHNSRKTFPSLVRDAVARASLTQTKTSGDSSNEKHRNRSKSKNKVPKNIRYDLENALVSLCDVWFEEIKPYLVRNNVKVHVHETGEGTVPASGGDRNRHRLPTGAPNCSHLDPGAASDVRASALTSFYLNHLDTLASSARECGLCQLLFNAANSIESAVSQASIAAPDTLPFNTVLQNPCCNWPNIAERKPRRQRRRKPIGNSHPLPHPTPVPRLCRTYSILPSIPYENSTRGNHQERENKCNKNSITDTKEHKLRITKNSNDTTTQRETSIKDDHKTEPKIKVCSRNLVGRHLAATSNFQQQNKGLLNSGSTKMSALFQNDLINIIAEKNEKRLQILYRCPNNEDCLSTMNLVPSPKKIQNVPLKKAWR